MLVFEAKGGGGGLLRPFSAQKQNVLFSADDKPMSAVLNQQWLCSVSATLRIIGILKWVG